MRPYLDRLARQGGAGVAAIGVAQEFQRVFSGTTYHSDEGGGGMPRFGYAKADRRVTAYYFYLIDEVFGPAFVKVCAYFPYPVKIWLNGHEYAKRAATAAGIAFTELDNGFATTDDPAGLQAICDTLGPGTIRVFCERWWARLPLPLTDADRAAGYWWDLAMRQVEVSRTIVFNAPRAARGFFEALCADNLDIGRPEQMQIIFGRRVRTPPPQGYRTRLLRSGDEVTLNAHFAHSRVKSYLKCGRAFRIETVINDTADLGVARRIEHLPEILSKARDVNRRMVDAFRVGQGCVLASPAFERVARPTLQDGRRAPALRFGDPRVMALVGALCTCLHVVAGFTNRSLRARVATLLGVPYSMGQMSYDLRRLRMKGLITRLPHSNTYVLTPDGHESPSSTPSSTTGSCGHWPRPTTTRPTAPAPRAPGDRPTHRRLHRRGPHDRVGTWLKVQTPSVQGRQSAEVKRLVFTPSSSPHPRLPWRHAPRPDLGVPARRGGRRRVGRASGVPDHERH
jgi:hypothetical protein